MARRVRPSMAKASENNIKNRSPVSRQNLRKKSAATNEAIAIAPSMTLPMRAPLLRVPDQTVQQNDHGDQGRYRSPIRKIDIGKYQLVHHQKQVVEGQAD